jgi:predicted SprT family Zn-dependent metalloprotease
VIIEINRATLGEVSGHEVYEVLLHELAHALAGPKEHHGPEWRRHCYRVGGLPKACCSRPQLTRRACLTCDAQPEAHVVARAFRVATKQWGGRVGDRCRHHGCPGCLVIVRGPRAPAAARR